MNIEEAKKTIQELLNSNEPICEYMLKHQEIEAMQKLLNELDKKDKVIHFMANSLTTDYHDIEWVEEYFYKLAEEILTKKKQSDIM